MDRIGRGSYGYFEVHAPWVMRCGEVCETRVFVYAGLV